MSTLQHEAHGSDVEEEKRGRVVNKNFKAMRMANTETKKTSEVPKIKRQEKMIPVTYVRARESFCLMRWSKSS